MASTAIPTQTPTPVAAPYKEKSGVWSWLTTVDHKRIGMLYLYTALVFFLIGGFEAELIRIQLQRPNGHFVSAEFYNQLFTMHGTTMIFLAIMPLSAAFFNFLIPLQIGARDVAFPRLNAFSYWIYLFGGVFIWVSFLMNAAPDNGWFSYVPLAGPLYELGRRAEFRGGNIDERKADLLIPGGKRMRKGDSGEIVVLFLLEDLIGKCHAGRDDFDDVALDVERHDQLRGRVGMDDAERVRLECEDGVRPVDHLSVPDVNAIRMTSFMMSMFIPHS